jgi:hypothetical protein
VLNEYRAIFGGLFARMYGLNDAQIEKIFAGTVTNARAKDLGLI